MSDSVVATEARRPRARKEGRVKQVTRRTVDTASLATYLAGLDLGVNPTIHVNGHAYQMALVTVDFGQPLKSIKLTPEQNAEFTDRLRKLGREVLNRGENAAVRVSHDLTGGLVYYASVL
jgi:hypothetical protein